MISSIAGSLALMTFKSTLKKIWAWSKKNWQFFVGVLVTIVLSIVFRRGPGLGPVLKRVREDYEKEIDTINRSHNEEIEKRDNAMQRYFKTMESIEKKYKDEKQTLEEEKRSKIDKILREHGDNPEEITRRISEITGFDIHVSE
ncbi:hypothetical protein CL634_06265 [bacterium]|nr:hypothetical protein [bacterium]